LEKNEKKIRDFSLQEREKEVTNAEEDKKFFDKQVKLAREELAKVKEDKRVRK
jgi:hypothetical protein